MSVSSWGKEGSKSLVKCFYCSEELRKDNLARHSSKKHPGLKPKSKIIISPGQRSLPFAKSASVKDMPVNAVALTPTSTPAASNAETKEPVINEDDFQIEDERDNINVRKRQKLDPPVDNEDYARGYGAAANLDQQFEEFKSDVIHLLDERLKDLVIEKRYGSEPGCKGPKKNNEREGLAREDINACKSLRQLISVVGQDFTFDLDNNIVYCKICTSDTNEAKGFAESRVGVFMFDYGLYEQQAEFSENQPNTLKRLKAHINEHVHESRTHEILREEKVLREQASKEKMKRVLKVGMRVARVRYGGILQCRSYLDFEKDLLLAQLNGTDIGDINHGANFARELTADIHHIIKSKIATNIKMPLDCTKQLRPVALIADKITPNKRTGHIMGLVVPTPENPVTKHLLTTIMLGSEVVKAHDAVGLAKSMLEELRSFGAVDCQLEGVAVDGQYIKLGIKQRLLEQMNVSFDDEEWFTVIWDPSHNINRADHNIREMAVFNWLNQLVKLIGDISSTINIGKGLEQSLEAADELNQKLYKLHGYSETRFAQYCHSSFSNFEKSYAVIIHTLKERARTGDSKVRAKSLENLAAIRKTTFVSSLCGVIDIYKSIAKISCSVQKVEILPWEVISTIEDGVTKLKSMAAQLDQLNTEVSTSTISSTLGNWPVLSKHIDDIKKGEFKGVKLKQDATKDLRSNDDFRGTNDFITMQNRLRSLAKNYAETIEKRILTNEDHPHPTFIVNDMAKCFDLQLLFTFSQQDTFDVGLHGKISINNLLKLAGIANEQQKEIIQQYDIFKHRFLDITSSDVQEERCRGLKDSLHIFEMHICSNLCKVSQANKGANCLKRNKPEQPKRISTTKVLHIFLRNEGLYVGTEEFLHFFLRCALKTHVESVAESMGSIIDMHSDKRRGLDVKVVGEEAMIHWNGPPLHAADDLLESALDRHFAGKKNWHFITRSNKPESVVISRMKGQSGRVPSF